MKRLLWIAALSVSIPLILILGLPPTLEYWMITIAALATTLLALWEYSFRRNNGEDVLPPESLTDSVSDDSSDVA